MKSKSLTTTEIRLFNRSKIYQTIYQSGQVSKQEIARSLQLSLPTVTQNLAELQAMELIEVCGVATSTGGRKPQLYHCIADARVAFGVIILKDYVRFSVLDLRGTILAQEQHTVPFANRPAYFQEMCGLLQDFIDRSGYGKSRILGVGIAIQGLTSKSGDHIIYGKILCNSDVTVQHFTQYLDYPCILIHDAEAAAACELWNQPSITDAAFLLLNRNFGGALIMNGNIHSGPILTSGIFEHMCLVPHGRLCYCGQHGCLEAYCSAESLQNESGQPLEDFFLAVRRGEKRQADIWDAYLHNLALAINNILMVVNGDIILGGLISSYMLPDDLSRLRQYVLEKSAFDFFNSYIMSKSTSDTYAEANGAALYYIRLFLEQL